MEWCNLLPWVGRAVAVPLPLAASSLSIDDGAYSVADRQADTSLAAAISGWKHCHARLLRIRNRPTVRRLTGWLLRCNWSTTGVVLLRNWCSAVPTGLPPVSWLSGVHFEISKWLTFQPFHNAVFTSVRFVFLLCEF